MCWSIRMLCAEIWLRFTKTTSSSHQDRPVSLPMPGQFSASAAVKSLKSTFSVTRSKLNTRVTNSDPSVPIYGRAWLYRWWCNKAAIRRNGRHSCCTCRTSNLIYMDLKHYKNIFYEMAKNPKEGFQLENWRKRPTRKTNIRVKPDGQVMLQSNTERNMGRN